MILSSSAALCVVLSVINTSQGESGTPEAAQPVIPRESSDARLTPPSVHGVALGLFSDDPGHDYEPQLREIAKLGASHVAVVVTYFQDDVFATTIKAHPRRTPTQRTIRRTLQTARRLGLATMLFPYVQVENKPEPDHWRGTLRPTDRGQWFTAYGDWIESIARIAARDGVEILSLGSEMSTMDVDRDQWIGIIRRVRAIYSGQLTYSANWDHYAQVEFWNHLDLIGLTGYFELVPPLTTEPTTEQIIEGWREWHVRLMRWQSHHQRPLLMSEVGYRSNDGAAAYPWRWGQEENTVDLEEQRQLYEAFARIWSSEPRLGGVFFWNWWGEGGPSCHDYTPRGKPAEAVLRHWFSP